MPGDRGLRKRLLGAKDPATVAARARARRICCSTEIRRVHADSGGVYGQLKVWDELTTRTASGARCTVERLMRASGIEGVCNGQTSRARPCPALPRWPPTIWCAATSARDRPDAVWLSDFTYIRTWEGWSYLAVVLDVHTRRIVGWQLASHMRQSLVTDALEMAIASRKASTKRRVAHSDNGSQYTSYEYTERLKKAGIAPSRGRTGTALDNAMAESVMATLKRELTKRYLEDAARSRARPRHLHRLVQRAAAAPLTRRQHLKRSPTSTIETTAPTQRKPPNHAGAKPGALQSAVGQVPPRSPTIAPGRTAGAANSSTAWPGRRNRAYRFVYMCSSTPAVQAGTCRSASALCCPCMPGVGRA